MFHVLDAVALAVLRSSYATAALSAEDGPNVEPCDTR